MGLGATAGAQVWRHGLRHGTQRGRPDSFGGGVEGRRGCPAALRTAAPPTTVPLGRVPLVRAALTDVTDQDSQAGRRPADDRPGGAGAGSGAGAGPVHGVVG